MKHGWNTKLQALCLAREAILVPEIVGHVGSDVRRLKSEWDAGAVTGGSVSVLDEGGVRLEASTSTLVDPLTNDGAEQTALTHVLPYFAADIQWTSNGAQDIEIHNLVARLDPRENGGQPKTVSEFRAQLFRITEFVAEGAVSIVPISREVAVAATGEAPADFTFNFLGAGLFGAYPRVGQSPASSTNNYPRTLVRIIALQSDGSVADNVAWMSNSAGLTDSGTGWSANARRLEDFDGSESVVFLGTPSVSAFPEMTIAQASYTEATITFTGANDFDDIAGSGEFRIVARGETPSDTTLTFEITGAGLGGAYVECFDGDVIGEDNSAQGGADLSGLSTTGPWDMRVTLTPSTAADLNTPTVRELGIELVTSTLLVGPGMLNGGAGQIEPQSLKGNIASAELVIAKTGEDDFFDYGSNILATNHIGQTSVRIWLRDKDDVWLTRPEWMLLSEWRIEDYRNEETHHVLDLVDPLAYLRSVIIPPFVVSSGNDGTRTATDVPIGGTGDLTDAYDDIIDGMVGLPARVRGPGLESSTTVGPKKLRRASAKDELDQLCYLDGSALIASQGKVRTVKVMRDGSGGDTPAAYFPLGSYTPVRIGPGFSTRTDEFFLPWDWNEARQAFDAERHYLNATALDKLGGTGLNTTQVLDEETAKWVTSETLADEVGNRIPQHFGNGLIVWDIASHYWHPELERGDVVAIESTRFVARSPINDAQIRGRTVALAIVVRIGDPRGTDLSLWIPGFDKIVVADGDVTLADFEVARTVTVSASAFGSTANTALRPSGTGAEESFYLDLSSLVPSGSKVTEIRSVARRRNAADSVEVDIAGPWFTTGSPPLLTRLLLATLTHSADSSYTTETYAPTPFEVTAGEARDIIVKLDADSDVADAEFWRLEIDILEAIR